MPVSVSCSIVAQAARCDMQLPEGWIPVSGPGPGGARSELSEWTGTYCYGIVILDVEIVIFIKEESVILAIALVGHTRLQSAWWCSGLC
jgi:hypothetical protein